MTAQKLIWARLALFVLLFSINFEMVNLLGDGEKGLSISRITALGYAIVVMATVPLVMSKEGKAFTILLFCMQIVMIIVSVYNITEDYGRFFDESIFSCALIFWVLVCHQRSDPQVVIDGLLYFALGAAIISVLGIAGYGVEYDIDGRLILFGDNSNLIGVRMTVATMVLIYSSLRFFKTALPLSAACGFMALLTALFMIETGSRVAAISFFVALMIFYTRYMLWGRKFVFGALAMGAGLAVAVPYLVLATDIPLMDRLQRSYYEGDLAGRGDVWTMYLDELRNFDDFVIGHGYSGFDKLATHLFGQFMSPHNVLVEMLLLGGIVGLLIFLAMNFLALVGAIRQIRYADQILPLMLLMPYFGSVLSGQTLNVKLMWVVLATCFTPIMYRRSASLPVGWRTVNTVKAA
ncbi:O-antigen ligase family protein [Sphingomonas soli]|uniref:O-antigen ligase family protein n=1 Tax=Sphingomonas soli TaxID=266127 RepID=UPI00082BE426|nr:O-antigen ligase family protein [Sphingomonas soli]